MKRFITMRWVFAGATGFLALLSLAAWCIQPLPAPAGKTSLVWVSDDNPLRAQQADLFNRSHPRYDLHIDPSNSDLQKVIVQCIAGVGPDLFDCFDGYQLTAYVRSGVALDVTDDLRAAGVNVSNSTFPGVRGTATLDGRVYGVPTNIAVDAVWFHKELFDAARLPYPTGPMKWNEMISLAQRLTVRDAQGRISRFGLLLPWWNYGHVFAGFGAHVFTPDGRRCIVDRPEAVRAVQLMYDLVYRYHVSPSLADEAGMAGQGGFGSSDSAVFGARRAAMAIGGRWWLAELRNVPALRVGVFESPYGTVRRFRAYGRATLVNRNGRDPKAALDFLRYLAGPAYNRLVNDQADGISAFPEYDQGERFLYDPRHPDEIYNAVWRDVARRAVGDDVSPYIDGATSARLLKNQFDEVQANLKTPAEAMRDAAANINAQIQQDLEEDPSLARRYREGARR